MQESLFFIAIIPPPEISSSITGFKEDVARLFDSRGALRSPPHITLHMPFRWKEKKMEMLIEAVQSFKFPDIPFDVKLKGFDAFPPRVIFVNVVRNDLLVQLQKALTKHIRLTLGITNSGYKNHGFHPHVTIGFRDLKKPKFYEAMDYFQGVPYEAKFEVFQYHLLKHNGATWDVFHTISLK